ncbi:hypothetical protein [uncultured Acetatifactor sp.]|nr:hypothetical protein [uncultured Acetatifactor sp.]
MKENRISGRINITKQVRRETLEADGYDRIVLNANELIRINTRITKG